MAGRIRQEDVEAVRERTDLVQVVSGYLQLKRAGGDSYKGLCPFHPEKTPSFSVSPSKQVYYCFGCGEGGDVMGFLRKVENLTFVEAVERLARGAGITVRYEGQSGADRRTEGRRQAAHKAIADAARLYHRMLVDGREGADARAYLAARGITEESVRRFSIGYAPGYHDFLLKRLTRGYSAELLIEAGLAMKDQEGNVRDRFRGRVVFPIQDLSGNSVGFGGRLLEGPHAPQNAAKYVNSPDSAVYRKGSLLYNLNRAKAGITRLGRAFIVEGYTDVVALDQAGIPTAVATCGTALGEEHIKLLARFTDRIVLAFDSDEAGFRAAERAYRFHQAYPVDLSVLVLPGADPASPPDPADFVLDVQRAGRDPGEEFLRLADSADPLISYMIGRAIAGRDLSGPEDRARAVADGLKLVAPLEDPVRRQEYARILAGRVGEPETAVMLRMQDMLKEARPGSPAEPEAHPRGRIPPDEQVELEVLKLVIQQPAICAERIGALPPDRFGKATHRKAFELVREATRGRGAPPPASVLLALAREQPRGEQLARLIAAAAVEPPKTGDMPAKEYAERQFLRLEEFALKREVDALRREVERLNPLKSPQEHDALFQRLVQLESARRRVRVQSETAGSLS